VSLAARFEYVAVAAGDRARTRCAGVLADVVARAILAGRLEAAPKLIYCRDLGPAAATFRARCCAAASRQLALYRRSRSYQRLRSTPVVTALTERVHSFLGSAAQGASRAAVGSC
jgi:hypothetical protein